MSMTMAEWKALPQWAFWADINGRKIPMNPATGKAAKSNDPGTWAGAVEAWDCKRVYRWWRGLDFALTLSAGIVGVDLDDCFDEHGGKKWLKDDARQIVQMLNTYTEYSPSGQGLHLFALGSIPSNVKREGFEMYAERHFMTVTGRAFEEPRLIENRNDELNALYVTYHNTPRRQTSVSNPVPSANNRYTQAALMRAMQTVSLTVNGGRNNALYAETAALVELVNGGELERADVERVMTAAGLAAGLEEVEVINAIASAFKTVTKARAIPPPRPRYTAIEDRV